MKNGLRLTDIFITLLVCLSFLSCGQHKEESIHNNRSAEITTSTTNSIIGMWAFPPQTDARMTIVWQSRIEANSYTAISKCTFPDGRTERVEVTVPARITEESLVIEHQANRRVNGCPANIAPLNCNYVIHGNRLILTYPNGAQMIMERSNGD